jgi:hypothetical protein
MTQGDGPPWAPPGAGASAGQPAQPFRVEGLAVAALVVAVVSLLVPLLPAVVALVLGAMAAQRIRRAPAGLVGGRGLITAALALSTIGLVAWVGVGALVVARQQKPTSWQAASGIPFNEAGRFSQVRTPSTTAPMATQPTATQPTATQPTATQPTATQPATTQPATTQPKIAAGRVGQPLTVHDQSGAPWLEITVTAVKFSGGDQFDQPQRGLYMGAYVKVRSLVDEQDIFWDESYALIGGRHYPAGVITELNEFNPPLEPVTLNRGEQTSGWLVFDVPARHGQLVLRDLLDENPLGIWEY